MALSFPFSVFVKTIVSVLQVDEKRFFLVEYAAFAPGSLALPVWARVENAAGERFHTI